MPVVVQQQCRKLRFLRICSSSARSSISFILAQRRIPTVSSVQKTVQIPQLLIDKVADVLVVHVVQIPRVLSV